MQNPNTADLTGVDGNLLEPVLARIRHKVYDGKALKQCWRHAQTFAKTNASARRLSPRSKLMLHFL